MARSAIGGRSEIRLNGRKVVRKTGKTTTNSYVRYRYRFTIRKRAYVSLYSRNNAWSTGSVYRGETIASLNRSGGRKLFYVSLRNLSARRGDSKCQSRGAEIRARDTTVRCVKITREIFKRHWVVALLYASRLTYSGILAFSTDFRGPARASRTVACVRTLRVPRTIWRAKRDFRNKLGDLTETVPERRLLGSYLYEIDSAVAKRSFPIWPNEFSVGVR